MRRVVITGMGTLNALGNDVETTWSRVLEGECGIREIDFIEHDGLPVKIAGHATIDLTEHFEAPDFRKLDPVTMYALIASEQASRDAGIDFRELPESERERCATILGTGIGGLIGIEEQHQVLLDRGARRVSPHFVPRIMANAVSGQVAIRHGLLGTAFTTASACASSGHAMGMALLTIRSGEADVVVTGGSEMCTTKLTIAGFSSAKALSTNPDPNTASRPFDVERDGFVLGDGAGVLVFEEYERALARGARIYAEVKGYGSTDDAFHITAPKEDGSGPARAIRLAMQSAGIGPDDVDYINAHGTSTKYNDAIETRAIKRAFGDRAKDLAISSTKSMIGHALGASSAVELVVTAMSVHTGRVHPTRGLTDPDPECDLDYVPGSAREMPVRNALSNSLGFGGHNVSLCIGRCN